MSFILDALKKSENERQRQNTAGIASIPDRGVPTSPPKWIWVVAALLAVNVAVIGALILWKDSKESTVAEVEVPLPLSSVREKEGSPEDTTFKEMVSEVKRNQPDVVPDATPNSNTTSASADDKADEVENDSANSNIQAGTVNDGLESFNELRAKGELQLPELRVDIHVYSEEPADRFVFVNMTKYKESATLSEGPVLKEITPQGVVLEYQNREFLLPRQ